MRTLATLATLLLGLAVVFWAPAAKAHCPDHAHCDEEPTGNINVYVTMSVGEEVTIATSGPLEVYAVCSTDESATARVQVVLTSSEANWRLTGGGRDLDADELLFVADDGGGTTDWKLRVTVQAVTPSGNFLGLNLGLGIHIFGSDCLVAGQVIAF